MSVSLCLQYICNHGKRMQDASIVANVPAVKVGAVGVLSVCSCVRPCVWYACGLCVCVSSVTSVFLRAFLCVVHLVCACVCAFHSFHFHAVFSRSPFSRHSLSQQKTLELFIYQVKVLCKKNDVMSAFWQGGLPPHALHLCIHTTRTARIVSFHLLRSLLTSARTVLLVSSAGNLKNKALDGSELLSQREEESGEEEEEA